MLKYELYLRSSKFWSISCARVVQSLFSRAILRGGLFQFQLLSCIKKYSDQPGLIGELSKHAHCLNYQRFPCENIGLCLHMHQISGQSNVSWYGWRTGTDAIPNPQPFQCFDAEINVFNCLKSNSRIMLHL